MMRRLLTATIVLGLLLGGLGSAPEALNLPDAGRGSEMAGDALVIATAVRLGGVLASHDPTDLELLVAEQPNVRILAV